MDEAAPIGTISMNFHRSSFFAVLLFGVVGSTALPVVAAPHREAHIEVELVAENASIQPGKPFTAALRFKTAPNWHTYWVHPGDTGSPTKLEWSLPAGFSAGLLEFPYPHRSESFGFVGLTHTGEVFHLVTVTPPDNLPPGTDIILKAKASWQVCDPENCEQSAADLELTVPVKAEPPQPGPWAEAIAESRKHLPFLPDGWKTAASVEGKDLVVTVSGVNLPSVPPDAILWAESVAFDLKAPQTFSLESGVLTVRGPKNEFFSALAQPFRAVLVSESGFGNPDWGRAIQLGAPTAADPAKSGGNVLPDSAVAPAGATDLPFGGGVLGMMLAGFLGGLILNVMPCVFPVISLKIMSFVHQSGEAKSKILSHGVAFTLGVLVFFWIVASILLGIRAAGGQADWAAQFQVPGFVLGMAGVMLLISLWLFGLLELGTSLTGVGGKLSTSTGYAGSFWSGALATLLATPCTGPFLGPAIFFGLSSPAPLALLFFTVMGLGMSLPYLLLAAFPALLHKLPRPGAWMESFKQFMGFPMLATMVWLVWTLSGLVPVDGALDCMLALVFMALAVWILHRFAGPMVASKTRGRLAALIAATAAVGLAYTGLHAKDAESSTMDPEAVISELRGEGKAVFADFTARWCLICQVNKRVLHDPEIEKALDDAGIVFLVVDYTRKDPKISDFLNKNGRSGVPYYPMFPADSSKPPIVLPNTLTKAAVLEAIAQIKDS